MSTDIFFGQGAEVRVGLHPTPTTDPTAWFNLEVVRLSLQPGRDRRDRPLLGVPLHNPLDQRKKVAGLEQVQGELVVPFDTRQLARWLALGWAAPVTTGTGPLYTHSWASGVTTARQFALQLSYGASDIRIFRGLTISALSVDGQGEQVEDFDVRLSVRGVRSEDATAWLVGAVTAVPAQAPVRRVTFGVDGVDTARCDSAAWSVDRQVEAEVFLSATPVVSGVRPTDGVGTGSATFRSVGRVYDLLEAGDTAFAARFRGHGRVTNHQVDLGFPVARLAPSPRLVDGPGLVQRTWSFDAEQAATTPVATLAVTNDVVTYA